MAQSRREFLKTAGVVSGAVVTGRPTAAPALPRQTAAVTDGRIVQTDVLDIGYEEHGDSDGFPIVLLHGFPYDVRSWDSVVPPLVEGGYRVLVPYLRGYGPTRFRDPARPRMAEQAALSQDVVDFADALGLERIALAGFDWGNRAACITAILHPERVRAQVAIGGYSVQNTVTPGPQHPQSSSNGSGTSGTSTPSADASGSRRIDATSSGTCGIPGRPAGNTPTRHSIAQPPRSTIRTS